MTKLIDANYEYLNQTIELVKGIEEGFLSLGERLKKIRDQQMYLPSYESFYDFLVECRMTESKASKVISVFETYIEKYNLPTADVAEVGWSILYEAIKVVKTKDDAKNLLHELKHRQEKDARDHVRQLRSGVDQDKCSHEDSYIIRCCRTCGIKIREEN